MWFEAKHEHLKQLAAITGNFTNIPWTLADKHQLCLGAAPADKDSHSYRSQQK